MTTPSYLPTNYDAILEAFEEIPLSASINWHTGEQMPELDDDSAGLVIANPPDPMEPESDQFYKRHVGVRDALNKEEYDDAYAHIHALLGNVWEESARVLRDGGVLAVIVKETHRGGPWENTAPITRWAMDSGLHPIRTIEWESEKRIHNILLFCNGMLFEGTSVLDRAAQAVTKSKWGKSVWPLDGVNEYRSLPTEIPHRLVQMYTTLGETVVVPFLADGVSAGVARELGRSVVGYEGRRHQFYGRAEQRLIDASSFDHRQILDWHLCL